MDYEDRLKAWKEHFSSRVTDDMIPKMPDVWYPRKQPSFIDKAGNFVRACCGYAQGGFKITPNDLYESRVKICQDCSFFDNNSCIACGCFVSFKAKMLSEDCPKGYWPKT